MEKPKQLSPKQKNRIKSEAYPNIYSILGFVGSCFLLAITNLIDNVTAVSVVAVVLLLVIAILGHIFTQHIWVKLEKGDKVIHLRKQINRYASASGYLSYPLFALAVLDMLNK